MQRVVLAGVFSLLISGIPVPAYAVLVSISGDGGLTFQTPAGGATNIAGTYGNFLVASGMVSAITAATVNDPNQVTLSNTVITNNGPAAATIFLRYSEVFSPVNTAAQRFYGTSMSGSFAFGPDPFGVAMGDSVTLNAFVDYQCTLCEAFLSTGTIDLNKKFTVLADNAFAPQNPAQGMNSFLCLNVVDGQCAQAERLRNQVSIFLGPGDSINVLATIVTLSAGSADVLDKALAELAAVPEPSTLLLIGSGLAASGVLAIRRKRRADR